MNNVFVEDIIKREWKPVEYVKSVGIVVGMFFLTIVILYVLTLFSFLIFLMPAAIAAAIWVCWILISNMRIEYEYSITDGYMVVDQIASRRKRKRLIAFELRDVETFGKFNEAQMQKSYDSKILAHDNVDEHEHWYMELTHKDAGRALVVFTPSERVMAAIKPFLRRQVAFQAFGR